MESTLDDTEKLVVETPQVTSDSDVVIAVRNVGKMYRLYDRPQDRLKEQLFWRFGKHYGREFWALSDVSFEVRRGEAVGIIGRNGSGKSTLLQIIAGTLAPTTGEVHVAGRVAALLELGSGFNPEFSGRENVFLNGSILGVTPEEMDAHFEEIATFADIGEFIDQPVKLYSSGMALRLAFAVQATVQKDVLIVDEALAVGDEAFQRKCMRTLEEFRHCGGTVLLVSHSAQTIVKHCHRGLFLHNGRLILDGPSKPVVDIYQRFTHGTSQQQHETLTVLREKETESVETLLRLISEPIESSNSRLTQTPAALETFFDTRIAQTTEITYGNGRAEIYEYGIYDELERQVNVVKVGETCTWRYFVRFGQVVYNVNYGMMLKTIDGIDVAGTNNISEGQYHSKVESGSVAQVQFKIRMNVAPGVYYLNAGVSGDTTENEGGFLHRRVDICAVRVIPSDGRTIYGIAYLEPQIQVRYV